MMYYNDRFNDTIKAVYVKMISPNVWFSVIERYCSQSIWFIENYKI